MSFWTLLCGFVLVTRRAPPYARRLQNHVRERPFPLQPVHKELARARGYSNVLPEAEKATSSSLCQLLRCMRTDLLRATMASYLQ